MSEQDLYAQVNKRIAERKGIAIPEGAMGAEQPAAEGPLPDWGLNGPVGIANAIGTGANEAFFNTKDMLLGEPAQEDKSEYRLANEPLHPRLWVGRTHRTLARVGGHKELGPGRRS